jgi:hypothetical protein
VTQQAVASSGLALQSIESAEALGQLQQQSRIAASTWRRWCDLLHLSPLQVTELWQEVCAPLERVCGQRPNISYLMRLRSARADIDIQEFKEEVAPIRHLLSFFRLLNDDNMGNEELSTAVLRYYKYALDHTLRQEPFQRFIDQFSCDLCRTFLIAKLARSPQITLSRVLHLLAEGRADIDRLIDLALQGGNAEGGPIATFLRLKSDNPDALFESFSTILQQLYNSEKDSDPTLLESRLRALCAFAPLRAILPSPEEAAAQTKKGFKSKGKKKQALAA